MLLETALFGRHREGRSCLSGISINKARSHTDLAERSPKMSSSAVTYDFSPIRRITPRARRPDVEASLLAVRGPRSRRYSQLGARDF